MLPLFFLIEGRQLFLSYFSIWGLRQGRGSGVLVNCEFDKTAFTERGVFKLLPLALVTLNNQLIHCLYIYTGVETDMNGAIFLDYMQRKTKQTEALAKQY